MKPWQDPTEGIWEGGEGIWDPSALASDIQVRDLDPKSVGHEHLTIQ